MNVTIVDYGVGNLHSVAKAFRKQGATVEVSADPERVRATDRLVLPGVGAFADGMAGLAARHLVEPIRDFVASGRPFLGICLGMQLLLGESEEFGRHAGLGLIPGRVVKIQAAAGVKVPQIGWNRIRRGPTARWEDSPLAVVDEGAMMYFVHSFTAAPERDEHRLADADYGGCLVSAAVKKDNVLGFQFHPEKSGAVGLAVIARFLA